MQEVQAHSRKTMSAFVQTEVLCCRPSFPPQIYEILNIYLNVSFCCRVMMDHSCEGSLPQLVNYIHDVKLMDCESS